MYQIYKDKDIVTLLEDIGDTQRKARKTLDQSAKKLINWQFKR